MVELAFRTTTQSVIEAEGDRLEEWGKRALSLYAPVVELAFRTTAQRVAEAEGDRLEEWGQKGFVSLYPGG